MLQNLNIKTAMKENITPEETHNQKDNLLLLDVRTPAEYEEAHVAGSVSHPLSDLDPAQIQKLSAGKSGCAVICRSGGRAKQAAEKLKAAGCTNITIMDGGVSAWEAKGLPLNRGQKTMSLERQVRIAAGFLVVLGALLAVSINVYWIALSAFVGAGLMFAGITDTCGMAMLLAKMPWNTKSCGTTVKNCSLK